MINRPLTCRDVVLQAFSDLETRSGKEVFRLQEIVNEVLRSTDRYPVETVRTQISSGMCANAPVHHANHSNDLERVGRGLYRRLKDPTRGDSVGQYSPPTVDPTDASLPWDWEGKVQDAFVAFLVGDGWSITTTADTATRAAGPDVLASKASRTLLAEVKGYPSTTYARGPKAGLAKPTNPATQARHWYAGALLSTAIARDRYPDSEIAIVLPYHDTYQSLVNRTRGVLSAAGISVYVVAKSGTCERVV